MDGALTTNNNADDDDDEDDDDDGDNDGAVWLFYARVQVENEVEVTRCSRLPVLVPVKVAAAVVS